MRISVCDSLIIKIFGIILLFYLYAHSSGDQRVVRLLRMLKKPRLQ